MYFTMPFHLGFSWLYKINGKCSDCFISIIRVYAINAFSTYQRMQNGGSTVLRARTVGFCQPLRFFGYVNIITRNTCFTMGSIISDVIWNIAMFPLSEIGSSWNTPQIRDLTEMCMRVCNRTSVFRVTRTPAACNHYHLFSAMCCSTVAVWLQVSIDTGNEYCATTTFLLKTFPKDVPVHVPSFDQNVNCKSWLL